MKRAKARKQKHNNVFRRVVYLLFLLSERLSVTGAKVQVNDNNDVTTQRDTMTKNAGLVRIIGCLVHGFRVPGFNEIMNAISVEMHSWSQTDKPRRINSYLPKASPRFSFPVLLTTSAA